MRRTTLAVICIIAIAGISLAGWTRTYGGSDSDQGYSVKQTTDGGYIVAGMTESFGAGSRDVYLVKTDALGDTIWTRTYGGSDWDDGRSIAQTTDGGYIVAGSTFFFGPGGDYIHLIKIDSLGDTLWTRTYGGYTDDYGLFVAQTSDSGYIVAGNTHSFGAGLFDIYLIKTDASGDTIWTRTYGGSYNDFGQFVAQTTDGGYIIVGYTESFGAGGKDIYLVKTDAAGDTLWTRTYGGSFDDLGQSVAQTTDGGYIVAGCTESFGAGGNDVYLVKTDATGDTLWTRTYGGGYEEWGYSVIQVSDGGYIVAGGTYSFGIDYYCDVYLVKTDTAGDTIWTRTYGGSGGDVGCSVAQTTDGGYIITGYTESFGSGGSDVYLIKTDSLGHTSIKETSAQKPEDISITVHPNPFNSSVMISVDGRGLINQTPTVEIFDINGRMVAEIPATGSESAKPLSTTASGACRWRPDESLASGVYLVRIKGTNAAAKVIYMK